MDPHYRYFNRCMERLHEVTWGHIHEDCRHAIFNYLVKGIPPGGFLTAVLTNDLYRAANCADFENIKRLAYVAKWVTHALPGCCYGSQEIIHQWTHRSDRERRDILVNEGLLPTLFEVIRDSQELLT